MEKTLTIRLVQAPIKGQDWEKGPKRDAEWVEIEAENLDAFTAIKMLQMAQPRVLEAKLDKVLGPPPEGRQRQQPRG